MREIVTLHVGQCGTAIGQKWWEEMCREHQIDDPNANVIGDTHVYFNQLQNTRYVPRAIFVDLDYASHDTVRASATGSLFNPSNFVHGDDGAANNWAKGHYTEGAELYEAVTDALRHEFERCDCLQGVTITHSAGGGTGGGLTALLTQRLREELPDRMLDTHTVLPSLESSTVVVEPYNAVLTLHRLLEDVNIVNCLHNRALELICQKVKATPTYNDLNRMVALAISGITCSLRFPGMLNSNMRKMAVNLVPFKRLHFLTPSLAPVTGAIPQGGLYIKSKFCV